MLLSSRRFDVVPTVTEVTIPLNKGGIPASADTRQRGNLYGGTYAIGVTKGSVDAYIRAARAFGLITDSEISQLIPAHFLERP
jgi:hypothetical protein